MFDYRAQLIRIVDADSLVMLLDLGFGSRQEEELRLLRVSAPERREPGGDTAQRYVAEWFAAQTDPNRRWPWRVRTAPNTLVEPTERRTFIRYLADVTAAGDPTVNLNSDLAAYLAAHPEWGHGS